jgi:Transposase
MEELDRPKASRVCLVTVLPCVGPDQSGPRRRPGKESTRCTCWQRSSSSPVGVDTHKHTHTAAVVAATTGAVLAQATVTATLAGYRQLLKLADQQPGQRIWAIEGTGGDGAGLTRYLHAHAEQVVELDRPKRTARRHGAKSDPLDATRAAREALGRDHLAQPRAAGHRAALQARLAARRSAVQATTDANASSTPWWSPLPIPSAGGWVA